MSRGHHLVCHGVTLRVGRVGRVRECVDIVGLAVGDVFWSWWFSRGSAEALWSAVSQVWEAWWLCCQVDNPCTCLRQKFAVWKLRGGVRECGERLCLWWCDVLVKPSVAFFFCDGAALWAPAFCAGLLRGDPVGFQNFVLGVGSSVQIL